MQDLELWSSPNNSKIQECVFVGVGDMISNSSIWITVEKSKGSKGVRADEGDGHVGP